MGILRRLLGIADPQLTPAEEKIAAQLRLANLELVVAVLRIERDSLDN